MRPSPQPRGKRIALLGVATAAIGSACASSNAFDSAAPNGVLPGTGGGSSIFIDGGHAGTKSEAGLLNPLCGHPFNCPNPDDALACKGFQGPGPATDAGNKGVGGASSGGSAGVGGIAPPPSGGSSGHAKDGGPRGPREGGVHDGSDGLDASDASDASVREGGSAKDASLDHSVSDASVADSSSTGTGGATSSGQPDGKVPSHVDAGLLYSCQVARPTSGAGGSYSAEPFSQCLPAGNKGSGEPCVSSAFCRPGLACVGLAGVGLCLPYCCDPTTSCEKAWLAGGGDPKSADSGSNLYCGQRALVDGSQKPTLTVPVCVPADRCTLGGPYPCTGSSCQCQNGAVCTVTVIPGDGGGSVRGTTACAMPGKGRTGEHCSPSSPCAAGYFCSASQSVCLKLCRTDGSGATCDPGMCQFAAGFPDKWGVCVGPTPAAR